MSILKRSLAGITAILVCSGTASAGFTSVSVGGIPNAFLAWDVPVLNPGDTWTQNFLFTDPNGYASAWGTIEARCGQTGASLNLTHFGMESIEGHAATLDFEFDATIEYNFRGGLKGAFQMFDADQDVNSPNGLITWTKGASWNGNPLFPLDGFYNPQNLLQSSLSDSSGDLMFLFPIVTLRSVTTVRLTSTSLFDAVYLPDSAYDEAVPAPASLAGILGIGALFASSRRRSER